MTVGLYLASDKEAVVIIDRCSSYSGRQSNSAEKRGDFTNSNYHGTIFGSGNGELVNGIITKLPFIKAENIGDFVLNVQKDLTDRVREFDDSIIKMKKDLIERKSMIIPEDKRQAYIEGEIGAFLREYEKDKHSGSSGADFIGVGYDKLNNVLRKYSFSEGINSEITLPHREIGSGADGANMYFTNLLQGVQTPKLDKAELTFLAVNAYSMATVNQGVGGSPQILFINKTGNNPITFEQANAIANMSGAHLSGSKGMNSEITISLIRQALESKNYGSMAKKLNMTLDTFTQFYVPFSTWQERANRARFDGKHKQR